MIIVWETVEEIGFCTSSRRKILLDIGFVLFCRRRVEDENTDQEKRKLSKFSGKIRYS
jgi:hypothetical protein